MQSLAQLDTSTYIGQIASVIFTFSVTWAIVSYIIVPKILANIQDRKDLMTNNAKMTQEIEEQILAIKNDQKEILLKASEDAKLIIAEYQLIVNKEKLEAISVMYDALDKFKKKQELELEEKLLHMQQNAKQIATQVAESMVKRHSDVLYSSTINQQLIDKKISEHIN